MLTEASSQTSIQGLHLSVTKHTSTYIIDIVSLVVGQALSKKQAFQLYRPEDMIMYFCVAIEWPVEPKPVSGVED